MPDMSSTFTLDTASGAFLLQIIYAISPSIIIVNQDGNVVHATIEAYNVIGASEISEMQSMLQILIEDRIMHKSKTPQKHKSSLMNIGDKVI